MIEELRARCTLLIEERKMLAAVSQREHRPYRPDEISRLAKLNGAIEAILHTIAEVAPQTDKPAAPAEAPKPISAPAEDYRLIARAIYDLQLGNYRFMMEQVGQSGRWLLATIAAAHFGGLVLLSQLTAKLNVDDLKAPMWALVSGLFLIFISGLLTYYNWSASGMLFAKLIVPDALVNPAYLPKADPAHLRTVDWTQKLAIAVGLCSVLCILIAAAFFSMARVAVPAVVP